MSTTRVIKLKLLTQTELVKVETSARTFAEFKKEPAVSALGIDWNSAKLIDRASKASFDLDEAVLPAIDALMFVTPTKTKSGADLGYKEVKAKIKEFKEKGGIVPFNYTQATTTELNKFWNSITSTTVSNVKTTPVAPIEVPTTSSRPTIYVDSIAEVITKSQLQDEAVALKNKGLR